MKGLESGDKLTRPLIRRERTKKRKSPREEKIGSGGETVSGKWVGRLNGGQPLVGMHSLMMPGGGAETIRCPIIRRDTLRTPRGRVHFKY